MKIHLARFNSSIGILTNEAACGVKVDKNTLEEDVNNVTCKNCLKCD
jgi:hypothetical protein